MISAWQPLAEASSSDNNEIKAIQVHEGVDLGFFFFNLFW